MSSQKLLLLRKYQRVCDRCNECYYGSKHSKICPNCRKFTLRKKIERRIFN